MNERTVALKMAGLNPKATDEELVAAVRSIEDDEKRRSALDICRRLGLLELEAEDEFARPDALTKTVEQLGAGSDSVASSEVEKEEPAAAGGGVWDNFPIADYDELAVDELMPLLDELEPDEVAMVLERESTDPRPRVVERLRAIQEAAGPPAKKATAKKATAKKATKSTSKKATTTGASVQQILTPFDHLAIELIVEASDNRGGFDTDKVGALDDDGLLASIEAEGIKQALIVTPLEDGTYLVVDGHRRLRRARKVGLTSVPAQIEAHTDEQRLVAMLATLQRTDMTPAGEAEVFHRLLKECKVSQRELARRVGVSPSHITKRLKLRKLPDAVRSKVGQDGGLHVETALKLTELVEHPKRFEKLVKAAEKSGSLHDYKIDDELQEVRKEATLADLKRREIKVVDYLGDGILVVPLDSPAPYGMQIDVAAHEAEPCVVARLDWHGNVSYGCSDPKRHWPDGESALKCANPALPHKPSKEEREEAAADKARRAEQDALERDLVDARARRRAFEHQLLERASELADHPAVIDLLVVAAITTNEEPCHDEAFEILGIESDVDEDGYIRYDEGCSRLHALRADPARRERTGLAIALATAEAWTPGAGWSLRDGWRNRAVPALFTLLEEHGYEPTPAECTMLARGQAANDKAAAELDEAIKTEAASEAAEANGSSPHCSTCGGELRPSDAGTDAFDDTCGPCLDLESADGAADAGMAEAEVPA